MGINSDVKYDLNQAKKELQKKVRKSDRGRESIYVSKAVWEAFKENCEPVGASKVLEDFMRKQNEEADRKKK